MHQRPWISILLAAVILQCPWHCKMGSCCVAGAVCENETPEASVAASCCSDHCPRRGAEPAQLPENPPIPTDCGCDSCICLGALPVDTVDLDEFAPSLSFAEAIAKVGITASGTAAGRHLNFGRAGHLTALPSHLPGLDMRAALSCWTL